MTDSSAVPSAILRVWTSSPTRDWDRLVDDNISEQQIPLDNGRHHLQPTADLGTLSTLPLELLHEILVSVDLQSLTDLRRVSQRMMETVDSIPHYRSIIKHVPSILRCILATETAAFIPCRDLFRTLTTGTCEDCGDFSSFVYLPTCSRVCVLCFFDIYTRKYWPIVDCQMEYICGLDRGMAADVPSIKANLVTMKTLPGTYLFVSQTSSEVDRRDLYDRESVRRAAEAFYGSAATMKRHVEEIQRHVDEHLPPYGGSGVLEVERRDDGQLPRRILLHRKFHERDSSSKHRHLAVARAPHLDVSTQTVDLGFLCVACLAQGGPRPFYWRRQFSADTFADHIKESGPIDVEGKRHLDTMPKGI